MALGRPATTNTQRSTSRQRTVHSHPCIWKLSGYLDQAELRPGAPHGFPVPPGELHSTQLPCPWPCPSLEP